MAWAAGEHMVDEAEDHTDVAVELPLLTPLPAAFDCCVRIADESTGLSLKSK